MANTARLISTARRAAVVAAAGAAAVSLAGLGVGAANAAVGDPVPDSCMSFSQDGGTTWILQKDLAYNTVHPIPGSFAKQTSFEVKNTCDTPARFDVLTGFWNVEGSGTAQLRADIAGKTGTPVTISGTSTDENEAKLLSSSGRLTKNKTVSVDLFIGLPQGETEQGFDIDPGWGFFLTEVALDGPTDPGTGGGNDNGSLGSLSGGSLGDLFGSGSSSGSLDTVLKGKFSSSPIVVANP
ncbi:hypothetical protein [Gordonia sp. (in: high G+C Gram-positive bacteria)]|uniref:hypothetical protein n=1 Tax=Gordonia sp. (in: high G+C Gram-positive bacteria) TaxID=84139 RepID=UPI003C77DABE